MRMPADNSLHGQAKQILLVEDHEDSAEMMTLFLESEGYRVQWVSTAGAALKVFHEGGNATENRPDLVLLDLTLPDIDGLEVGKRLKESIPNAPPIIIMSAKSAHAVQSAAQSIAAAGFVRKPFATDKLMASIRSALSMH
jgi:DNA-binding response OmpR family regulator